MPDAGIIDSLDIFRRSNPLVAGLTRTSLIIRIIFQSFKVYAFIEIVAAAEKALRQRFHLSLARPVNPFVESVAAIHFHQVAGDDERLDTILTSVAETLALAVVTGKVEIECRGKRHHQSHGVRL